MGHFLRFRLSPEEQETAYEMKAGMMRKLEVQNAKLNAEIMAQKRMKQIERENKAATTVKQDEKLSRLNAIKLMRMYERRAKQGANAKFLLQYYYIFIFMESHITTKSCRDPSTPIFPILPINFIGN